MNRNYFIVSMILVIMGVGCIMPKVQLRDSERDKIKNAEEFNEKYGKKGVGLQNRKITEEEIKGLKLVGSEISNCDFIDVKIKSLDLNRVTFKDCLFVNTEIEETIFKECKFERCTLISTMIKKSELQDCLFKKVNGENRGIGDSNIIGCDFLETKFEDYTFYKCKTEDVSFKKCNIVSLLIGEGSECRNMLFEDSEIMVNIKGKLENIKVNRCNGNGPIFTAKEGENIVIENSERSLSPIFGDGKYTNVTIRKCKMIQQILLSEATISNLLIEDCEQLYGFNPHEVKFEDKVIIRNCNIKGAYFRGAEINNTTFENCTFDKEFAIQKTTFNKMKFINVIFKDNYWGDNSDDKDIIKYINSDRFHSRPYPGENGKPVKANEEK